MPTDNQMMSRLMQERSIVTSPISDSKTKNKKPLEHKPLKKSQKWMLRLKPNKPNLMKMPKKLMT